MELTARKFEGLIGKLKHFSDDQLREHLGLYEGYVSVANEIASRLESDYGEGNYAYSPHSELKRRFAVAFNGVTLHEMFFDNLTDKSVEPKKELMDQIVKQWGSYKNWEKEMQQVAAAGPGWVVTAHNPALGYTTNLLVTEHHEGWPLGFEPLVVMDMWEHAYFLDFKSDKDSYAKAFLQSIDWEVVNSRWEACHSKSSVYAGTKKTDYRGGPESGQ